MKITMRKFLLLLLFAGFMKGYGQGFSAQYVPGLQLGSTKIKYSSGASDYKFGAGLAIMELDALKGKFYLNVNASSFYYSATTLNKRKKMLRDSSKYAKNNGQLIGMRMGYGFGKNAEQKIGGYLGGSYSEVNATASYDVKEGPITYGTFGGGLFYYQKLSKKLHVMAKLGYEKMKGKKYSVAGRLILMETTIGYEIYQRFGVSIQPAFYGRKFDFIQKATNTTAEVALPDTKASQFVLKIGITKFFR